MSYNHNNQSHFVIKRHVYDWEIRKKAMLDRAQKSFSTSDLRPWGVVLDEIVEARIKANSLDGINDPGGVEKSKLLNKVERLKKEAKLWRV